MATPRETFKDETDDQTPPTWTLGDRLRKARRVADLDAQSLAATLGVSRNTISNYENDHVVPDRRTLIAWAFATGISLGWIEHGEMEVGQQTQGRPVRRRGAGSLTPSRDISWSLDLPILVHPNLLADGVGSSQGLQRHLSAAACR